MNDAKQKPGFLNWLGFTDKPDFSRAQPLGIFFGVVLLIVLALSVGISLINFFGAAFGFGEDWGEDRHTSARNYALILAAIGGVPFIVWRTAVAQKQANIADQGLITDRITKAVEQLGAEKTIWEDGEQSNKPNLEIRLGGIYALERIAQDSPRDHFTVVEILCAYVRENASVFNEEYSANNPVPRIDIQSILTVLGRRESTQREIEISATTVNETSMCTIDLSCSYIPFADMDGSNFDRTDFSQSNLTNVEFRNASARSSIFYQTDFSGAHLGWSNFKGSDLSSSIFDEKTRIQETCFDFTAIWNVDFSPVTKITATQLSLAIADASTKLPNNLARPNSWPTDNFEFDEHYFRWFTAKQEAGLP